MRKFLISILLASAVATPALARPNDDNDRAQAREERAQAREERQQAREQARPERPANVERQSFARPERQVQPQQQQQSFARPDRQIQQQQQSFDRQARVQDLQAARATRRDSAQAARMERVDNRQQVAQQIRDNRELRQSTRATPRVMRTRVPVVSNVPRPGTQPPVRAQYRPTSQPRWSTSWRNNNRYDWQNHRRHHRSLFHLGFYYDPFGWGYSPYQIGWRLWPSYYSSRYWINDPWQYRLPYAPAGTQWVRYYNDAVLVDTWSGQVVDVLYNFFW
jgi:Ni/Co efflux regulator RcnB